MYIYPCIPLHHFNGLLRRKGNLMNICIFMYIEIYINNNNIYSYLNIGTIYSIISIDICIYSFIYMFINYYIKYNNYVLLLLWG